ncbi:MAG TPA: DUF5684 domain-containing protein [Ktedonobacterales bacterium]
MLHAILLDQTSGSASLTPASVVSLVIVVLLIAAYWRIFSKAGQPGWAAIIPIYSTFVLLRVVGRPWWWFIVLLIPVVNIIFGIILVNDLSKSFGHGVGYTLGLIFLSLIFIPILGFGGSQYTGPAALS